MQFIIHTCSGVLLNPNHCQTKILIKAWITRETKSNIIKWQNYFTLNSQNEIPKEFILISNILSVAKLNNEAGIILNISLLPKKTIQNKLNWCIVNGIFITRNHMVENLLTKKIHDVVHEDFEDIVNLFTNYFVGIGCVRSAVCLFEWAQFVRVRSSTLEWLKYQLVNIYCA